MALKDHEIYTVGAVITGIIVFIAAWIYCIGTYGFLLGVGLGWLPAFIIAVVVGLLWPFIALALLVGLVWLGFVIYVR